MEKVSRKDSKELQRAQSKGLRHWIATRSYPGTLPERYPQGPRGCPSPCFSGIGYLCYLNNYPYG
jgi:hypothetical protein